MKVEIFQGRLRLTAEDEADRDVVESVQGLGLRVISSEFKSGPGAKGWVSVDIGFSLKPSAWTLIEERPPPEKTRVLLLAAEGPYPDHKNPRSPSKYFARSYFGEYPDPKDRTSPTYWMAMPAYPDPPAGVWAEFTKK